MVERERISALMDGELTDDELAGPIQQLKGEEGGEDWRTYHLIGDSLRGEMMFSDGFAAKVRAQLATEPTVLAPPASRKPIRRFERYAMAAAASVVGIAVVGWFAIVNQPDASVNVAVTASTVKSRPAASAGSAVAQIDPTVSELFRVHQEESPTAVMQGSASLIRPVAMQDVAAQE